MSSRSHFHVAALLAVLLSTGFALALEQPVATLEAEAARGSAQAQFELGRRYFRGEGVKKDDQRAYELNRSAADGGHAEAAAMIGYFYSVGLVVAKDDVAARRYFEAAAEKGSPSAQLNLGILLLKGRGGAKEPPRGIASIEKAVAQGSLQARLMLGEIFLFGEHAEGTPDWRRAYDVLMPAAESGNARAQNMVGVILRDGGLGRGDPSSARLWFEKAAQQGDGKACSNLGHLIGFNSKDRATRLEALKWLMIAEHLNETTAKYTLLENGPACAPADLNAARKLATEAIESLPKPR